MKKAIKIISLIALIAIIGEGLLNQIRRIDCLEAKDKEQFYLIFVMIGAANGRLDDATVKEYADARNNRIEVCSKVRQR